MGRGNTRPGDATYYVSYDQFNCFSPDENGNDTEQRDYDCEADYVNDYIYNIQYDTNLLQHFTRETTGKEWYDRETRIIADNTHYIIVVYDNEWSVGFSLIRKDFWKDHSIYDYDDKQEKIAETTFIKEQDLLIPIYKKLLMKTMSGYSNEIYVPTGPWTSGKITKEMIEDTVMICPYCGEKSDSKDPKILCADCRQTFGHHSIDQL